MSEDRSVVQEEQYEGLHFCVSCAELSSALFKVSGVVERRNIIDILACINIRAQNNTIKFAAADSSISMFASLPATILRDGEVRVAAHTLYDIVRKLPSGSEIRFKICDHEKLLISCESAYFSLPNVFLSKLPAFEKEDYAYSLLSTSLEDNYRYDFTLLSTSLVDLFSRTKFSISLDDTRSNMHGMHLHTDDQFLHCVTTDGRRLSRISKPKPNEICEKLSIVISRKTMTELLKILDVDNEVNIKLSDKKIKFTCGEYILISTLMTGTFPDYIPKIPEYQDKYFIIDSKRLLEMIDRVSVVASDKLKSIKLSLQQDKLVLHSSSQEHSNATESIDVKYNNAPIEIGFNARYLLDVLSCIKNKCKLNFIDSNSAIKITDEDNLDALYIVMPIRT